MNYIDRQIDEAIRNKYDFFELYGFNKDTNLERLAELPHLKEFRINYGEGDTLPSSIRHLKKLQLLNLNNNKFKFFPEEIKSLPLLNHIDISTNLLTEIPSPVLGVKGLKFLFCKKNDIKSFPEELFNLDQLEILDLTGCPLSNYPIEGPGFPQLQKMSIYFKTGNQLPAWIFECSQLEELIIRADQLSILDFDFSKLKKLKTLKLNLPKLQSIPEEIGQLDQLDHLEINRIKATTFPEALCQLPLLRILVLNAVPLVELPSSFCKLKTLKQCTIKKGKLTTLPESFGQLPHLYSLILSNSKIESIPDSLAQLDKLLVLDLSGNPLDHLPKGVEKLPSLEYFKAPISLFESMPIGFANMSKLNKIENAPNLASGRKGYWIIPLIKLINKEKFEKDFAEFLMALLAENEEECLKRANDHWLIRAMSIPRIDFVRIYAEEIIAIRYHQKPDKELNKDAVLTRYGSFNMSLKQMKENLKNIGLKYQTKNTAAVSHVLIGKLPKKDWASELQDHQVLITEKIIGRFIEKEDTPYLMDKDFESSSASVGQLLKSGQEDNIQIALEMIKTGGLPGHLITAVFIAYQESGRNVNIRRSLQRLLKQYGSLKLQQKLKKGFYYFGYNYFEATVRDSIKKYAQDTELNADEMAEYSILKKQQGYSYFILHEDKTKSLKALKQRMEGDLLNLKAMQLGLLPNHIKDIKEIKKIDLNQNLLKRFPMLLFEMPQLESIDLKNNYLLFSSIPKNWEALPHLQSLTLTISNLTKKQQEKVKKNLELALPNCKITYP